MSHSMTVDQSFFHYRYSWICCFFLVEKLYESVVNFILFQDLSYQHTNLTTQVCRCIPFRRYCQLDINFKTITRTASESTSESYNYNVINMRVSPTIIASSNDNFTCMRINKRKFTREFHQLSLLHQTRTRVASESTTES